MALPDSPTTMFARPKVTLKDGADGVEAQSGDNLTLGDMTQYITDGVHIGKLVKDLHGLIDKTDDLAAYADAEAAVQGLWREHGAQINQRLTFWHEQLYNSMIEHAAEATGHKKDSDYVDPNHEKLSLSKSFGEGDSKKALTDIIGSALAKSAVQYLPDLKWGVAKSLQKEAGEHYTKDEVRLIAQDIDKIMGPGSRQGASLSQILETYLFADGPDIEGQTAQDVYGLIKQYFKDAVDNMPSRIITKFQEKTANKFEQRSSAEKETLQELAAEGLEYIKRDSITPEQLRRLNPQTVGRLTSEYVSTGGKLRKDSIERTPLDTKSIVESAILYNN